MGEALGEPRAQQWVVFHSVVLRWPRIGWGGRGGSIGALQGKELENRMFGQNKIRCPTWRFRLFWRDRTERKHVLRRNGPRVSNFLSHRIAGYLKFMIFDILGKSLHHQMILGPPDGSLDFF